jgi:hypothetical protein
MLLFDKNFKEDKKKVAEIKEEIKQGELKITKGKESVTKMGKKFDISDESDGENVFEAIENEEDKGEYKDLFSDISGEDIENLKLNRGIEFVHT